MTNTNLAAPLSGGNGYTDYFVIAAFISLGVAAFAPMMLRRNETLKRRWYWAGTFGAAISVFIAGLPDWVGSLSFACVAVFGMWLPAYFNSEDLIKIRGKVYGFLIRRSAAVKSRNASESQRTVHDEFPDAYNGDTTPAKLWSLMIVSYAFLAAFIVMFNSPDDRWMQVASIAMFVIFAVALGYFADGSFAYPIARRQYVQFVLISLMTAGTFAIIYLSAYYLGRRWPLRSSLSSERVAPPRYWDK